MEQFLQSPLSRVLDKLADGAYDTVRSYFFKPNLETLQIKLELLSDKASDVEEQINEAERSGRKKKKRKREVESWLANVKSARDKFLELKNELESPGFIKRFRGGGRAAELHERVGDLIDQCQHFGKPLISVCEIRAMPFPTTMLIGKAFEENLERIWRLLVDNKVSRIGIHGMGGVGKTALTMHIHNRLLEKAPEECVIWVTVSQVFTIKELQDDIARVVDVDLSEEHDENKRAATLCERLSRRKNVLMLDDVWDWKNIDLGKVMGYQISMQGVRLILTTRSLEVCRKNFCQEVITVGTLPTNEAWDLFHETLGKETRLAHEVEEVAKDMAELCDGLPLAIIILARSMRGETAIHVWRNALEELKKPVVGQNLMEDMIFKVLKYSFDRLNPDHEHQGQSNRINPSQLCFLYCSLYPEDHGIRKDQLVRNFILEELMDKRKSRKAQLDLGYSIVDGLVNACLLESPWAGYVKMHDLVRAMALKINEGKTMVIAGDHSLKEIPREEEWTEDLEKVSLMYNRIEEIPHGMSPHCPKLSTLLLCHNPLRVLPDSFFAQMHGLSTLDLSRTRIRELPNSVSDLESLKALRLQHCASLVCVPYLGKLKALRELDLSNTAIKEVPQGIEELVNLRLLSLSAPDLKMLPPGLLLKFQRLQCLKIPRQIPLSLVEIEGLKQLEEFRGSVKNVRDFNKFFEGGKSRMYAYDILVGSNSCSKRGLDEVEIYFNSVTMCQYNLREREGRDGAMLAPDIQSLTIDKCEGLGSCLLEDFPVLISDPKSLKTLEIWNCGGIECILTSQQLIMAPGELQSQFSNLEEIKLFWLRDFVGLIHDEEIEAMVLESLTPREAVFSSLRHLRVDGCDRMKKLGIPVSEFANLEVLQVYECKEIEEIIEISDEEGRGEGEARSVSLPKLKHLYLDSLPRLKSICNATMICTSISRIGLAMCPTLKKLPLRIVPPPATLKQICIREGEKEWWESMQWEDPTHPHLLQPFLRFY